MDEDNTLIIKATQLTSKLVIVYDPDFPYAWVVMTLLYVPSTQFKNLAVPN